MISSAAFLTLLERSCKQINKGFIISLYTNSPVDLLNLSLYLVKKFIISILISTLSVFKNCGKWTTSESNPANSTHLSKQFWHSFLNNWFLSAKFGISAKAKGFAHCLNPCFKASINFASKETIIFTKFLLLSDNFFLTVVIKLFKPFGNILIFAAVKIFSMFSQASFFSAHFPFKSLINFAVIFFEISCGGIKSPPPDELFPSAPSILATFFFFPADSFGSITLTLSNSASINFKVDSFMSLVNVFTSFPKYLYNIHKRLIAAVLTCGLELFAITLQKSIISLFGKSLTSYSSTTLPRNVEYSINNLALFFLDILPIICFKILLGSIISKQLLINSTILSFNFISANFSW